jgi:hypothetical protein
MLLRTFVATRLLLARPCMAFGT